MHFRGHAAMAARNSQGTGYPDFGFRNENQKYI
jgi:hypothetical protein